MKVIDEIINASKLSREQRKLINRIFRMANRRIDFLKYCNVKTPERFYMKGLTEQELKNKYVKCVEFFQTL